MKPRLYTRGFTVFEILVVMGMFVVVGGFALFVSMETYSGSRFRSDRDLLVAALQRARAQAMNNVCLGDSCTDGLPHGVHIEDDSYTIFQGNYVENDELNATFDSSTTITKDTETPNIVFLQLSGTTSSTTVMLSSEGRTSLISIGEEGQISWTN